MTKPTGAELFWTLTDYLGNPYEYGGWDCSEAVLRACKDVGVPFVDGSTAQKVATTPTPLATAPIGALGWKEGHDGLLDGAGGIAHAANEQRGTVWDDSYQPLGLTYAGLIPGIDYYSEANMPGSTKAVQNAAAAIGKGSSFSGMCEKFTRTCFGFSAKYASAKLAYEASKRDGTIVVSYDAPAGVPVFWDILSGTNERFDHVAVSVGGGYCITTSAGPGRTVAKVKIADLTRAWHMRYLGWGDTYHGVKVYTVPVEKKRYPEIPVTPSTSLGYLLTATAIVLKHYGYSDAGTDGDSRVRRMQNWLNEAWGEKLLVDGDFGPKTKNALLRRLSKTKRRPYKGKINGQVGSPKSEQRTSWAAWLNDHRKNLK